MDKTLTDQEVVAAARRYGITPRELENWRGKYLPRPQDQIGKGQGKGSYFVYPESILGALEEMAEYKKKGYTKDEKEIWWRRWENGHHEDWQHVKNVVDSCIPPLPDYTNLEHDLDNDVEPKFFPFFKNIFKRVNPIPRIKEGSLLAIAYYYGWPSLTGEHYLSDDPREEIEKYGGKPILNIFDLLEKNNLADVRKWHEILQAADEKLASKFAPLMKKIDDRIENHKDDKDDKDYKLFHHRVLGKKFIWYSRASILVLLLIEETQGIRFTISS